MVLTAGIYDNPALAWVALDILNSLTNAGASVLSAATLQEGLRLAEHPQLYAAILDPGLLRLNTSNLKKVFAPLFETGALVCSVHGRAGATELLDAMEATSVAVADALCKDAASPAPAYVSAHAAQP